MLDVVANYIFYEIAALLVLSALIGFVGLKLKQPLIVCFVFVGIFAGPSGLDLIKSDVAIDLLAELGIALLLFMVGLKLDLALLKSLGPPALAIGVSQISVTIGVSLPVALLLGFPFSEAVLIAIAMSFSSTIVIVKLLSDKREIDALHGRLALGVLIVQDIVVVITMIAVSAVGKAEAGGLVDSIGSVVGGTVLMLLIVALFTRYLANYISNNLAAVPELLLFFVIGWATMLAALGHYMGIGKELGGLLAGVSLASSPLKDMIASRLGSLRDFLLLFFFIALGASLDVTTIGDALVPALILSALALLGKPVLVYGLARINTFEERTSFLTSVTLGQISEFSLILFAMAHALGLSSSGALSVVTLVALITITVSGSMITYMHGLYRRFESLLGQYEEVPDQPEVTETAEGTVLIFGLGRYGMAVAEALRADGRSVRGIDFNPEAISTARRVGFKVQFGDGMDPEFLSHISLAGVTWIVSTIPDHVPDASGEDTRLKLLRELRANGFEGGIAVVTQREENRSAFLDAGATRVLLPYLDAALQTAETISDDMAAESSAA